MRHTVRAALALSCLIAFSATAQAQPAIRYQDAVTQPDGTVITQPVTVTPSKPLPVTGSFSATTTGFAPASTGTPISVTTGGVTGTLPAGTVVIASNVGATNNAYCKLGASATTSDQLISPNSWFAFTVGVATQLTCITSTSTTTVNMVGGSGLPTGAGGGGGGSGGAITAASGAFASGAIASGAVASGAVASGAVASGALAAGAGTDGWDSTQGAKADSVCGSATGTCTLMALIKFLNNAATASTPAGTNAIGTVQPGTTPACGSVLPISQITSTDLHTASGKTYICSMLLVVPDAEVVSLVEGTGTVCATGTAALVGATTAANGMSFAANGGAFSGGGGFIWLPMQTTSDHLCLLQSGSGRIAGVITYNDH